MVNRLRGEVEAVLDGRPHVLCLTLGALAELEAGLCVEDLGALAQRFGEGRLKAREAIALIGAGLRGGGHPVSDEEVAGMRIDRGAAGFVRLVGELLEATFDGAGE